MLLSINIMYITVIMFRLGSLTPPTHSCKLTVLHLVEVVISVNVDGDVDHGVVIATMSLVIIVGLSSIVVIVILLCGLLCIEW